MTSLDRIGRRHWIAVAVIGALALMLDISADYLLGLSDSTARIKRGTP